MGKDQASPSGGGGGGGGVYVSRSLKRVPPNPPSISPGWRMEVTSKRIGMRAYSVRPDGGIWVIRITEY